MQTGKVSKGTETVIILLAINKTLIVQATYFVGELKLVWRRFGSIQNNQQVDKKNIYYFIAMNILKSNSRVWSIILQWLSYNTHFHVHRLPGCELRILDKRCMRKRHNEGLTADFHNVYALRRCHTHSFAIRINPFINKQNQLQRNITQVQLTQKKNSTGAKFYKDLSKTAYLLIFFSQTYQFNAFHKNIQISEAGEIL